MAFERLGGFLGKLGNIFTGGENISTPIENKPENTFDARSLAFLDKQMDRLGIDPGQRDEFTKNMYDWSRQVRNIESDDNPMAAAGSTSAKGVYQFTDASVDTARNRMLYADKQGRGYGDEFIRSIPQNPQEWSNEQADSMFLSNMMAQTGSDDFLRKIGAGDEKARQDAYYKFHHTAPDEATISRVNRLMPYEQQPVDQTMDSYTSINNAFKY
jgi:hypothetical protein